jgi:hypothetical protein
MRVTTRIHEWFAERVPWVQYPDARFPQEKRLLFRLLGLTNKQRWWIAFAIFWGSVIALSIYGNLI